MSLNLQIDTNKMPLHVAIIMDGNGRWAKKRGKIREYGHKNGATSVKKIVEVACELGIRYLTLYTFSNENWNRPKHEIDALMSLLVNYIDSEIKTLINNNIRFLTIGNSTSLPDNVQEKNNSTIKITSYNTGLSLILALNYGAKQDIAYATQLLFKEIEKGELTVSDISEEIFSQYLSTASMPDPELLIRTSGEFRLSNFLLWEIANTKLYFTETLWPDFDKEEFYKAILNFQKRKVEDGKPNER